MCFCLSCTGVWDVSAGLGVFLSAASGLQHHPHPVAAAASQAVLLPPVSAQEGDVPTLSHTPITHTHVLMQCVCCVFFQTLDQSELQGDGVALSLEEQLCALSLSEPSDSEPKDTVSLNGSRFSSELFQDTRESTKVNPTVSNVYAVYEHLLYLIIKYLFEFFRFQPF